MSWRELLSEDAALRQIEITEAWQRVHDGNGSKQDGRIVVASVAKESGYYDVPDFEAWVEKFHTAAGFAEYCMRHQAKREIFAKLLMALNNDPARMRMIERDRREITDPLGRVIPR